MKEDIKLPAILRDVNTSSSGESNQQTVLMYKDGSATHIHGAYKGQYVKFWDTNEVDNITSEYLANTYGKVNSKEHAEFIVELAEVENCDGLDRAKQKIATTENFKGIFFNFYTHKGDLCFAFLCELQAKNRGEKLITIPLPPNQESDSDEWPKEVFYKGERWDLVAVHGDTGKVNISSMEKVDRKCDDEWPNVNDEVQFKPNPSIDSWVNARIEYQGDKFTILKSNTGREYSKRNSKLQMRKLKTPEEELLDDIAQQLEYITDNVLSCDSVCVKVIASALMNNKINGLSITKKQ